MYFVLTFNVTRLPYNRQFIEPYLSNHMNQTFCPCQSGKLYQDCCEPLHQDASSAPTAEQLMRSRYSAYCLGHANYLLATLHPSKRRPEELRLIEETIKTTTWLGLKILDHKEANDLAEVEFVAFYQDAPFAQLHERSRFTREAGQWFYHDGVFMPESKLGRNEPCFCGSGSKFKHCHGN